jgi:7-cyano-7-deazaguanine synthase
MPNVSRSPDVAVLLSAGLDSAVLAAAEARTSVVQPIYVSAGLAWEHEELAALARLLATGPFKRVAPLVQLSFTVQDLYPSTHWALRGVPPAFDTPDADVYLAGRNVILLSKAGIYCGQRQITRIALGPLAGNPFPDATPEFFSAMARALSLGLGQTLTIDTPLAAMEKEEVVRLGRSLGVDLGLTLSCMNPQAGLHCGRCSKCRERRDAFRQAGGDDPTAYAVAPLR